ncbi:helix-turn-helix domain-containing protein [Streptomyces sp. NPDC056160]|uniref:helix-turn-helix domain-containing protein n=1 Tax=Streptomyces sp. NPDC056160 TaxID=3345731 RepID=UPI0035DC4050
MSALAEGRDRVEVAALFKVSVRAVDNWWTRWQAGGRDALLSRPRGRRVGNTWSCPRPSRPLCGRPFSITCPVTWGFPASCGRGD